MLDVVASPHKLLQPYFPLVVAVFPLQLLLIEVQLVQVAVIADLEDVRPLREEEAEMLVDIGVVLGVGILNLPSQEMHRHNLVIH